MGSQLKGLRLSTLNQVRRQSQSLGARPLGECKLRDYVYLGFVGKDIKVKKSKNKQKPTRNEETSDQEKDMRKDIKAGSARQQEKKVNEDPIEVKGSIMTSFQKFKDSFGCFESPRTKDVKVRKLVY
ncbi:hypothetical protein Tco_0443040 [Tanacetum coccineum]